MDNQQIEQIKELLSRIKAGTATLPVRRMIETFEAYFDLYAVRNQEHADKKAYLAKLQSSYKDLWVAFDDAAAPHGLTANIIEQHLQNPANFTAAEWQNLNTMKQEDSALENPSAARPVHKKLKKNKKNVRI